MPLLISVIVLTISINQHGAGEPISAKLKTYTLFTIIPSILFCFHSYSCEKCIINFKFLLWYDDSIYGEIIRNKHKKSKLSFVKKPAFFVNIMSKTLFCDHGSHSAMNIGTIFVQFCDQDGLDCGVTDIVDCSFNLRKHITLTKLSLLHIFLCLCNSHR